MLIDCCKMKIQDYNKIEMIYRIEWNKCSKQLIKHMLNNNREYRSMKSWLIIWKIINLIKNSSNICIINMHNNCRTFSSSTLNNLNRNDKILVSSFTISIMNSWIMKGKICKINIIRKDKILVETFSISTMNSLIMKGKTCKTDLIKRDRMLVKILLTSIMNN